MTYVPLPLELFGEVTTADGTRYRWDANQPPGSRLRNLSFSTKIGEGFSSAQGQLARRIDLDYPDLNLVDTVTFRGADGSVAWEGRMSAMPHSLGDTHGISVTLTGWMAHTKDRKFSEVFVDRDLSGWGEPSAKRRRDLLLTFGTIHSPQTQPDPSNNETVVATPINGPWAAGYPPVSEAWYDAGPTIRIGKVIYSWQRNGDTGSVAPWTWQVWLSNDDLLTAGGTSSTGNLVAAGPVTGSTLTAGALTSHRYAALQLYYNGAPGGADGATYSMLWKKLAVYGSHGLTTVTGEPNEPPGVLASDVIRNIVGRWCPKLDTSGVEDTSYVIQHLAFKDRVFPYDALLDINKYHLWQLAVWEDKTLHFKPYDLSEYDWEIRTDDPGTTFEPQGPGIDDVFNGMTVTYTDLLTGVPNTLTPDVYPNDLSTADPQNPWNEHGIDRWDEIQLSTPSTLQQALQIGRAALGERNTPKAPGTITVKGYIRDRAGSQQPVWKVRAGDTIAVTNYPNATPRLIVETTYDDEQKQVSLSIDRPFALLDAYLDRVSSGLTARGLS
jgi:hypothetical protein